MPWRAVAAGCCQSLTLALPLSPRTMCWAFWLGRRPNRQQQRRQQQQQLRRWKQQPQKQQRQQRQQQQLPLLLRLQLQPVPSLQPLPPASLLPLLRQHQLAALRQSFRLLCQPLLALTCPCPAALPTCLPCRRWTRVAAQRRHSHLPPRSAWAQPCWTAGAARQTQP